MQNIQNLSIDQRIKKVLYLFLLIFSFALFLTGCNDKPITNQEDPKPNEETKEPENEKEPTVEPKVNKETSIINLKNFDSIVLETLEVKNTEVTTLNQLMSFIDESGKFKQTSDCESVEHIIYLDINKTTEFTDRIIEDDIDLYVLEKVSEIKVLTKWEELLNKYQNQDVNQLVFVKHTTGSKAIIDFYVKENSEWKLVFEVNGCVGTNGIDKTREGDKKTPTGEFGVKSAFGIKANPGTSLNYINVTDTIYACDENSEYYNTIIDTSKVDHPNCKGEHMYNYKTAYAYGLEIDYNPECIYPLGSAIFLHVASGSSTAGCVAMPESNVITILKNATSTMKICIYDIE